MEISTYAPVIIPTLNRFDHFRQCLESLERCTGAESTDVYIGLDYPPAEKYVEGWKKIDEYLKEKETTNGFRTLNVIRHNTNCGVGGLLSNANRLRTIVLEKYDSFILSEDDNIFSPNFLEYINSGLDLYKDNPRCIAICGYNYNSVKLDGYNKNVYLSQEYSAWGVAFSKETWQEITSIINRQYAENIMSCWKKIWSIYRNEPRLLNTIIMNLDCGRIFGDTMIVAYQYLNNKYSLFPKVSKVRNMGFDGSGTSIFEVDNSFAEQKIDNDDNFVCDMVDESSLNIAMPEVRRYFKRSSFMNIVILIRCFIYWLTKKDILYYEAKRRNKALFK